MLSQSSFPLVTYCKASLRNLQDFKITLDFPNKTGFWTRNFEIKSGLNFNRDKSRPKPEHWIHSEFISVQFWFLHVSQLSLAWHANRLHCNKEFYSIENIIAWGLYVLLCMRTNKWAKDCLFFLIIVHQATVTN